MHAQVSLFVYPYWEDNFVFLEREEEYGCSCCLFLTGLSDPWSAGAAVFWRTEHKAGLNSVQKAAQVCETWQHY